MAEEKKEVRTIATISNGIQTNLQKWVKESTESKSLRFPANYSPENALKSALLMLAETNTKDGKVVLEACTQTSIVFTLQKMLQNGLNPMKKQVYFMAFGSKLGSMDSYFGAYKIAKAVSTIADVNPQIVYKDDIFEYEIDINRGTKKITKHTQKLENIDNSKIIAAYCVVIYKDGTTKTDIMSIAELKQSWAKSTYGVNQKTHGDFAQEMAKRTVLKRATKLDINSSDDGNLFMDDDDVDSLEVVSSDVKIEVKEKRKTAETIDIAAEELIPDDISEEEDVNSGNEENVKTEKQPEEKVINEPDF